MDTTILICDRLGRILDFNRSASQITGITSRDPGRRPRDYSLWT